MINLTFHHPWFVHNFLTTHAYNESCTNLYSALWPKCLVKWLFHSYLFNVDSMFMVILRKRRKQFWPWYTQKTFNQTSRGVVPNHCFTSSFEVLPQKFEIHNMLCFKMKFDSRYEGFSENFVVNCSETCKRLGNTDLEISFCFA